MVMIGQMIGREAGLALTLRHPLPRAPSPLSPLHLEQPVFLCLLFSHALRLTLFCVHVVAAGMASVTLPSRGGDSRRNSWRGSRITCSRPPPHWVVSGVD